MKERTHYLLAALIVLALLQAAGCPARPRAELEAAAGTYNAVLTTLADLREAGKISDATALRIEGYRKAARAALDQWHEDFDAGKRTSADIAFRRCLALLIEAELAARETP